MGSFVGKLKSVSQCLIDGVTKNNTFTLGSDTDTLTWHKELERHAWGQFSFAVVQANTVIEDQSQVEVCQKATFVGVYDGHEGPVTSQYISKHFFPHFIGDVRENRSEYPDALNAAVLATEQGFLEFVNENFSDTPLVATAGSCCLAGVKSESMLYVANMGDSRAVLGSLETPGSNKILAFQITEDHKASCSEIRQELIEDNPHDTEVVCKKRGVWRVKGLTQITRSIGDVYLKKPEFALGESFPRFHLQNPIVRPVLRDTAALYIRHLKAVDKFVVFASKGLWEHLSNQVVADIVHRKPRAGIARKLIERALKRAARKAMMSHEKVIRMGKGGRRAVHDDITVVVVFFDEQANKEGINPVSIRPYTTSTTVSDFSTM